MQSSAINRGVEDYKKDLEEYVSLRRLNRLYAGGGGGGGGGGGEPPPSWTLCL
jgi:hypothetical protein